MPLQSSGDSIRSREPRQRPSWSEVDNQDTVIDHNVFTEAISQHGVSRQLPTVRPPSLSFPQPDSGITYPEEPARIAKLSPPLGQFVLNMILQIAALVAAIAFGVFAVKSVTVGNEANRYAIRALEEAVIANKISMLAFCFSNTNQVRWT